eukprot:30918-Pelagococcus_subviridis.AAC.13
MGVERETMGVRAIISDTIHTNPSSLGRASRLVARDHARDSRSSYRTVHSPTSAFDVFPSIVLHLGQLLKFTPNPPLRLPPRRYKNCAGDPQYA